MKVLQPFENRIGHERRCLAGMYRSVTLAI
jgi:hypothetical protein